MKKPLLIPAIVGIVIIAGLAIFFQTRNQKTPTTVMEQSDLMQQVEPSSSTPPSNSAMTSDNGEVKTFTVDAQNFSFSMKEIKVKKGDRVKIVLVNKGGFHDWVVDEFNAKTKQIGAGSTDTIEFTADKVGTFQFYCSVGNHRAMGMVGNLIVE
jgi:plastocyanin